MHGWLADAHAEGPTPVSAILSGLLLNVALYALLRFKTLIAANHAAIAPGPLLVGLGLLSMAIGALMLYRRDDIKRMFAYSSIEHMGAMAFAFGLGAPIAAFAGLLHMIFHGLTKSAIFFVVGQVTQAKGTQKIAAIRGLTESNPVAGWLLLAGVVAIAGLPPLGLFMSEFLMVSSATYANPALAVVFVVCLLTAFGALMLRVSGLAFGEPDRLAGKLAISWAPVAAHLAIVFVAGLYAPEPVTQWLQTVAKLLEQP